MYLYTKKILISCYKFIKEIFEDGLFDTANELTYKLILSFFPFIMVFITILGLMHLNMNFILNNLIMPMPQEVVQILKDLLIHIEKNSSTSILSLSLAASFFNASTGFLAIIKGLNKIYGYKENRSFIKLRLISATLSLTFSLSLIISVVTLVFGMQFLKIVGQRFFINNFTNLIISFVLELIVIMIMFISIIIIYKMALTVKVKIGSIFIGAMVTLILWIISSSLLNVYIRKFTKYSSVYGSISSIFILILWLNLVSFLLLLGAKINKVISKYHFKN